MNAAAIAAALHGQRSGSSWMARCPAHDDKTPSLSISGESSRLLVHCHAGCSQADVIRALKTRGLWSADDRTTDGPSDRAPHRDHEPDDQARTEVALKIWGATSPALNTLAQTYLRSRGIRLPVPSSIRFHPGLKHPSGGTWPAMVSLVTTGPNNTPVAIHRTFLGQDGDGKAPATPPKMMLGPCRGGAVRLADADDEVMVGEGIETCLSAMQATGKPAWAALSAPGLRALELPSTIRKVIILADSDDAGENAALAAANRWMAEGHDVRIARPPRGQDFNDMLIGASNAVEVAA
jgi:putative DNA primase/helicase